MADWIKLHRMTATPDGPREEGAYHVNLDAIPIVEEGTATVLGAHGVANTPTAVIHLRIYGDDGRPVKVEARGMDAERLLRMLAVKEREAADAACLAHLERHGSTPADMATNLPSAA